MEPEALEVIPWIDDSLAVGGFGELGDMSSSNFEYPDPIEDEIDDNTERANEVAHQLSKAFGHSGGTKSGSLRSSHRRRSRDWDRPSVTRA